MFSRGDSLDVSSVTYISPVIFPVSNFNLLSLLLPEPQSGDDGHAYGNIGAQNEPGHSHLQRLEVGLRRQMLELGAELGFQDYEALLDGRYLVPPVESVTYTIVGTLSRNARFKLPHYPPFSHFWVGLPPAPLTA